MTAVKRQIQYREVAEKIRAEILREKFPHGTPLFSAPQFAKQYKVSLKTANSALNYLAAAGVIFRRQGSGSFVNHPGEEKRSFLIGCTLYDRQQDRDSKVKQILAVAGEQAADLLKREGCHIRSIPTEAWLAPQQGIDCFRRLDGLLLSGAALLEESCRALVEQLEIPVVVFQAGAQWALQVSQVIVNHVPGIREIFRQATRRYTGLTVLYLNHPNGNIRKNAFIREALRAGYRLSEIECCEFGAGEELYRLDRTLAERCRGRLLFSCSDLITWRLPGALSDAGLQYMRDYELVGYDNFESHGVHFWPEPTVTSMDYPLAEEAAAAAASREPRTASPGSRCREPSKPRRKRRIAGGNSNSARMRRRPNSLRPMKC